MDKRSCQDDECAAVAPAGLDNAEIQARIDSAKDLIKMKSKRVIEGDLIAGFNQKFPAFTFAHKTRTVRSIADLVAAIASKASSKAMREAVFYVLHEHWDNNHALQGQELDVLHQFGWECSGHYCDCDKMQRTPDGGCIRTALVKQKAMLLEKVINSEKKYPLERIYVRGRPLTAGAVESAYNAREAADQAVAVKKGLFPARQPILLVRERATLEEHGFRGMLGLYEGHPRAPRLEDVLEMAKDENRKNEVVCLSLCWCAGMQIAAGLSNPLFFFFR